MLLLWFLPLPLSTSLVKSFVCGCSDQADRKLFGFSLFSDGAGGGLPIVFRPESGGLRLGSSEAPFSLADLPANEDIDLRIFIDKHVVEVFANDRQALLSNYYDAATCPSVRSSPCAGPSCLAFFIQGATHIECTCRVAW